MTTIEDFKKIRSNLNLVVLICEYLPLYPSLRVRKLEGSCPFCQETTKRSLAVSDKKQIFYCFSCHEGGDSISFISSIKKITPKQAIDYLLKRIDDEEEQERKDNKDNEDNND
jgi:DNA primase